MPFKTTVIFLFMLFAALTGKGMGAMPDTIYVLPVGGKLIAISDTTQLKNADPEKAEVVSLPGKPDQRRQKIVSALFAFPFPFGFLGAHRIMLGTKPWIPVVYVATFGGCFGLLPMIDFCTIVFSKDIRQYENNPHIFMWLH